MENNIVLRAETIISVAGFPITNTLLVSWLTMAILILFSVLATRRMKAVPTGLQNFFEMIVEGGYQMVDDLAHDKARVFFPYVMTFFLFIITANWLGLFPGFGTLGINKPSGSGVEFIPLFRSINSDLNTTLALALLSAFLTHMYAIRYLGVLDYLKRWVSLNPIFLFIGLLELVSEVTKIISLSFRLFGNIFAGEVVLSTISSIFAFVIPLPFYFLEIIVGFVQAAVFMMLTLVFMMLLSQKHVSEEH